MDVLMKHVYALRMKDYKEEKILPVSLIAQLVEHCTGIAEVMDSSPVEA